jgi:hypothetical protein
LHKLLRTLCVSAALVGASAPLALASTINGQITITGNDTFDPATQTVSFVQGTGQVGSSAGDLSTFTNNNSVNLVSGFNYTTGPLTTPLLVYSTTENGSTLNYFLQTITQGSTTTTTIPGVGTLTNLTVIGSGYFTLNGFTDTVASFDLNSQAGSSPTISFSNTSFSSGMAAPEISASGAIDAAVLLIGGIWIVRGRRSEEVSNS